jgi:RNA polymerase sigma-70 factor (ECF subfamily)
MTAGPEQTNALSAAPAHFTTTHWSVILAAVQRDTSQSAAALEALCRAYWQPLYAYVRRRGYSPHDAQDLTQAFFARLLEKDYLQSVDRKKGKFRSFLLAALEHFLANEWRNAHTQKRGGQVNFIPLEDDGLTEARYLQLPASNCSPEQFFEQQWAIALLEQAVAKVQAEFRSAGKEQLFDELKIFLTGEKTGVSYADLAVRVKTTEAALKMSVSRMRQRYGEVLRAEIASTVDTPEAVDEELRALFTVLSR